MISEVLSLRCELTTLHSWFEETGGYRQPHLCFKWLPRLLDTIRELSGSGQLEFIFCLETEWSLRRRSLDGENLAGGVGKLLKEF